MGAWIFQLLLLFSFYSSFVTSTGSVSQVSFKQDSSTSSLKKAFWCQTAWKINFHSNSFNGKNPLAAVWAVLAKNKVQKRVFNYKVRTQKISKAIYGIRNSPKKQTVWTSLDEFGRKKLKNPKIADNYRNNYFIILLQYILCKHAQKRSFMTNLIKSKIQAKKATFLFINLDHFWLQSVEKTE